MIEYAVGHFEVEQPKKRARLKPCKGCGLLCPGPLKRCKDCGYNFYNTKRVPTPKKHYEVEWKETQKGDAVYLISSDYWESPQHEKVLMSDSGEYLIMKVTSQGLLVYNKCGFAFFDMVNEGYNPKTGITRGKTKVFKRGRNPKAS